MFSKDIFIYQKQMIVSDIIHTQARERAYCIYVCIRTYVRIRTHTYKHARAHARTHAHIYNITKNVIT